MGLDGLGKVIEMTHEALHSGTLPPKEYTVALRDLGHHQGVYARLRADELTALQKFVSGPEYAEHCRVLAGAFPETVSEFRERLARFGFELPAPASNELEPSREPPVDESDLDDLLKELRVAKEMRDVGEDVLAWAHLLGLELDVHSDAIARLLEQYPDHAIEFIDLLDNVSKRKIQDAFNLRVAINRVTKLPLEARAVVSELLSALHQDSVANEIVSSAC